MTPSDFIAKWSPGGTAHGLNERAGAQPHFIDLCRLLGVPEPADPDRYCFERGLVKTGSAAARTDGFADVWLRGHFAWEYKRPGRSLKEALKQRKLYALPLENPPEWTEQVPEVIQLGLSASPDRIVAKAGFEKELAKRTLTNLYNQRPAWLAQAHAALDRAVAAAYGWDEDPATLSEEEILRRLLGVNRARAGSGAGA